MTQKKLQKMKDIYSFFLIFRIGNFYQMNKSSRHVFDNSFE
jgi:hypothetical protein